MNKKNQLTRKFNKLCFIVISISSFVFCQDYLWPVKIDKALTAVFGEERPGRYHTGIDIRTFGEIGFPVIAIDHGYISRIQTSSKKYGKTIYLHLHDGNTAVYAHLDHFMPELDNLASSLHQHFESYSIDQTLTKNKYNVSKGDTIGYSGDTGGVSGPHLHFEIRDANQQPLNPFDFGLTINDQIPPIINSIAIIPINENSKINGFSEYKIFPLEKINNHKYVLLDTISINGPIGIAINTHDRINGQEFNFGIYDLTLYHNDSVFYSMKYDEIMWKDSKSLYTEKNYPLARNGYGKFHHLFSKNE